MAELACQVLPADFAGITMLVDGKPSTGVFTDRQAPELDEAQYSSGRGPCLDAFRNQRVYRIDSTADEERWPEFAKTAAWPMGSARRCPCRSLARGESLGALNLYSRLAVAFDDHSVDRIETFTRQAAIVLSNAQVYWDARQLNENLNQAMAVPGNDRLCRRDRHGWRRSQPGGGISGAGPGFPTREPQAAGDR